MTQISRASKLLVALACFLAVDARAQTVENDLVGLGMAPEVAEYLAGIIPAGAALDNNVYLKGDNQAGSATINIAKIDTSDNTVINSSASDLLILQLADDASRLISFAGTSDSQLDVTFGDGGTTATQRIDFSASTADADDDSTIQINGGGSGGSSGSRGGYIAVEGNEVSGGGDVRLVSGSASGSEIEFAPADTVAARVSGVGVTFDTAGVGVRMVTYVPTMAATPVAGTNDFKPNTLSVVPTAAANTAALLPATPIPGDRFEIVNSGPNSVRIKAGGAATMNGATAGGYVVLATLAKAYCSATAAANYNCELPAAPTPAGP